MLVVNQLLEHCSRAFGSCGELYGTEEADTLIAVYPPDRSRGWWTYATLELHRTGATECLLYSYRFERELIAHLARVAQQIKETWERKRERLVPGDVFPLSAPIQEESSLDFVIATPADYEEAGFDYFTNGVDVIRMMMLHAIAPSEALFAQKHGLAALEELFARAEVNSLDFMRTPAI